MFRKPADIEIATDRQEYAPGDIVHAMVRVGARRDADAARGGVQLVCRQRYEYSTTSTDSQGRSETRTTWSADEQVVAEAVLLGDGTLRAGDVLEHAVSLPLPADSAPTAKGSVTEVVWEVRARIDARLARDPKAAAGITVGARPLDRAAWGQLPSEHPADDCDMVLEFDSGSVTGGDRLAGAVSVTPHDDMKARRVRVRLERVEEVHRASGSSARDAVVKEVLADDIGRLPVGVTQRFPFQILIPHGACPSLVTDTATVRWQVVGEVERRMRRDEEVLLGVHVY